MQLSAPHRLAAERDQLLAAWQRAFRRHPDWLTSPPPQLARLLGADAPARPMAIRKLHDRLGFCAKGTLARGGLCAGALFRTDAFLALPQRDRSGARRGQTVHIEHTVPVGVLAGRLADRLDATPAAQLRWLLQHSVATAMRKGQDGPALAGVARSTEAFTAGSAGAGRPFLRYARLFGAGERVWDVWHGAVVDAATFGFDAHWATIRALMLAAGADRRFVAALDEAG